MYTVVAIALFGSFAIAVIATHLVRGWALRVGFVDAPGGHKRHKTPIALGGGIAIFVSVCIPVGAGTIAARLLVGGDVPAWVPKLVATHLSGIAAQLPLVLAILGGALVLHVVGLIDDRKALGPWVKLTAQIAVAAFIAGPMGVRVVEVLPVPLSVGLTIIWIVVITNAFNFLDNMDGLSAGVAAIAAVMLATASMRAGQIFVPLLAWVVVGTLCGFLLFNFSPARIFMGDAGSLVVGYLMGVLTILTTYYDPARSVTPMSVVMPLVVLAVPLYDVISVVTHRIRLGESPFRGDWRHFSHRLVKRGMSRRGAVLTIYLATAATGLPAILLPLVDWAGGVLLLVQCLCVIIMIAILEHTGPSDESAE